MNGLFKIGSTESQSKHPTHGSSWVRTAVVVATLLVLMSGHAVAGVRCFNELRGVTVSPNGFVHVEKLGNWTWPRICNIQEFANGVSAEACQGILSLLLTAQTTNKRVVFWFPNGSTCDAAEQESWKPLEGWYFGPMLED